MSCSLTYSLVSIKELFLNSYCFMVNTWGAYEIQLYIIIWMRILMKHSVENELKLSSDKWSRSSEKLPGQRMMTTIICRILSLPKTVPESFLKNMNTFIKIKLYYEILFRYMNNIDLSLYIYIYSFIQKLWGKFHRIW